MDLCWQSDVSAFEYAVQVGQSFSSRSKHLLILWLQSPLQWFCSPRTWSLPLFSLFPYLFAMKWWDQMPCSSFFGMLSFEPAFSLSCFTFIRRLFSSFLLSATRVVSSRYLRLLVFLPAILIPAWASYTPAFCLMYSAYKLNKQGKNI